MSQNPGKFLPLLSLFKASACADNLTGAVYVEFLKVERKRSLFCFIVFALAAAAWAILLTPGDELFYSIFIQYLLLPVLILICGILSVKKGKVIGWLSPVIFAGITIALPCIVFGTTNVAFAVFALVPAALSYIIGGICYSVANY